MFSSLAGVSRSVTLVVAYVMTVTTLGWQEALAAVKVARPCASPNVGFQNQLQEFETSQLQQVIPPPFMIKLLWQYLHKLLINPVMPDISNNSHFLNWNSLLNL